MNATAVLSSPNPQEAARAAHTEMRVALRQTLNDAGVPSNPGWDDTDILSSLKTLVKRQGHAVPIERLTGGDTCPDFVSAADHFRNDLNRLASLALSGSEDSIRHDLILLMTTRSSDQQIVQMIADLVGDGTPPAATE